MTKPRSVKERLRRYFRERVGEVIRNTELQEVARPAAEWARRIRELRDEEGWAIRTHTDDATLRLGEYRLDEPPPPPGAYTFTRPISTRLRAQVLERNGYTCQMCGVGAGDEDVQRPGRRVILHVGHIVDRSQGGRDEMSNLRAMCSTCNQGARNLVQEPPSWAWLLGQIGRANVADQQLVLEWLKNKFDSA